MSNELSLSEAIALCRELAETKGESKYSEALRTVLASIEDAAYEQSMRQFSAGVDTLVRRTKRRK